MRRPKRALAIAVVAGAVVVAGGAFPSPRRLAEGLFEAAVRGVLRALIIALAVGVAAGFHALLRHVRQSKPDKDGGDQRDEHPDPDRTSAVVARPIHGQIGAHRRDAGARRGR